MTSKEGFKLERRTLDELIPLAPNPRRGNVDAIAKSLSAFGQTKPIVIAANGTILAGNHTVEAARLLGWSDVLCVVADHLSDSQQIAYAIADNRTSDLGSIDHALAADMIAELPPELIEAVSYDEHLIKAVLALRDEYEPETNVPDASTPSDTVQLVFVMSASSKRAIIEYLRKKHPDVDLSDALVSELNI